MKAALGTKGRAIDVNDAVKGANPYFLGWGDSTAEFKENCQRCVIAYEARRRGYDVAALPTFPGDELPKGDNYARAFKGYSITPVGATTAAKTQKNLESQMHSWGTGSRAIVSIPGHVFNAENVRGKIRYVDAQTGTVYSSSNVFSRLTKNGLRSVGIVRTDNLKFSDDAKKYVTPVTDTMRRIEQNRRNKK